jgi:hypothetical protein
VFDLFLFATIASLLIVSAIPLSQLPHGSTLEASANLLSLSIFRVFARRPPRAEFPRLLQAEEFAFDRALDAYEELIDATCAARHG